jgi:hypothetical protein
VGSNPASPTNLVRSYEVVGGQDDCARNQRVTMRLSKMSSRVILGLSCSLLSLFAVPSVSAEDPSFKSPLIVAAQFTPAGSRWSGGQGYAVAKGLRVTLADSPSRSGNDRVEIARMINRPGSNKLKKVQNCEIGPEANACVIANPNRYTYSGVLKARFITNGRYGPWNEGIPGGDLPHLRYPYLPDGTKLEKVGATSSGPSFVSSKTFEEIILADEGIVSEERSKFTKPITIDTLQFAAVKPLVRVADDSSETVLDPNTCVGIDSNRDDGMFRATSACLRFSFKDALAIVSARSAKSICFGKPFCQFLYLESGDIAELTRGVPDDLKARLSTVFVAAEPGAIFLQVYPQPDDGFMVGGGQVNCKMVRVSLSNGIPECVPEGRVTQTYRRSGPENSYVVAESKSFFKPEDRNRVAAEPEMVQFHTWKNGVHTAVGPVVEVFNRIVGTGSQPYFDFFLESSGNLIVTDTSKPETSLRWTRVTRTVKYSSQGYKDTWYEAKSFVRLRMIKPDGAVQVLGAVPVLFKKDCLKCDIFRPSVRFLGSFADGETYVQISTGDKSGLLRTWFSGIVPSMDAAISLHRIDTNSGLVEEVSTSPIKALESAYGSVDGPGTWDDEAPKGLLGWSMLDPALTVNVGGLTFGLYGRDNVSPRNNRGKYGGYLAQYLPELRPLLTSVVDARWIGAAGKYLLIYGLDSGGQPILSSIDSATMLEKVVARGPQTRIGKSWGRDWLTFFGGSSEDFCGCLVEGTWPAILPLADNRFTLVGVNHDRTRFSITELVVPG